MYALYCFVNMIRFQWSKAKCELDANTRSEQGPQCILFGRHNKNQWEFETQEPNNQTRKFGWLVDIRVSGLAGWPAWNEEWSSSFAAHARNPTNLEEKRHEMARILKQLLIPQSGTLNNACNASSRGIKYLAFDSPNSTSANGTSGPPWNVKYDDQDAESKGARNRPDFDGAMRIKPGVNPTFREGAGRSTAPAKIQIQNFAFQSREET
ncbi:hypothetical protein B0H13DRAFT_1855571 [Mycena leptocephala]|nr:hypothetical protein B0H13DRAFT_1855571 [Mycena leptocephala]